MSRAPPEEAERCLNEEIARIDRSILLLVEARGRAYRRLRRAVRTTRSDPEDRATRATARSWAVENGIPDTLAERVVRWLARERARASRDRPVLEGPETVTCILAGPPRAPPIASERMRPRVWAAPRPR